MFRMSLESSVYIIDFLSIDQESDDKLEFNMIFRKIVRNYYDGLWAKRISFKDFEITKQSKDVLLVPDDTVYNYFNRSIFPISKDIFNENSRFYIYGNHHDSANVAIIDKNENKSLIVEVDLFTE